MLTRLSFCTFVVIALLISRFPAQPQETKAPAPKPFLPGNYIVGLLKTDLSTKHSKVGDPVELEVVPIRWNSKSSPFVGFEIQRLPAHARLFGTVTMVQRSAKGQTAALAIHVVEVRSKSGSQPVDGTLAGRVSIIIDSPVFGGHVTGTPDIAGNPTELTDLDGATVVRDPILGGILSSKRDLFLPKDRTRLLIRTPLPASQTSSKEPAHTPDQLAGLRAKCAPYFDTKIEDLESQRVPLPPHECVGVLGWMRDSRVERLYGSEKPAQ
jgi:hypothetical protein